MEEPREDRRAINIRVDEEFLERLERIKSRTGLTSTPEVVRMAVRDLDVKLAKNGSR